MPFEPIEPGLFTPVQEGQPPPKQYLCALEGWPIINLPSNQAEVDLAHFSGSAAISVTMPFAGHITAATLNSNVVWTAGIATFNIKINAVEQFQVSLDSNNTLKNVAVPTVKPGFKALDHIGVSAESVGWTPTTADIECVVWVVLELP